MRQRSGNSHDASLFTAAPLPVAVLDAAERLACLRLIRSGNVGPVTFRELVNQFGGAQRALDALPDLTRRAGGPAHPICPKADAERELAAADKIGVRPIFTIEPGYPASLAATGVPPPLLYVKGNDELLQKPTVAIVGSRQASAAGHKLARQFAAELGRAGYVIASGLARGIDGAAHEAALLTGTVAVVAGGIDIIYPPEHADLTQRIAEKGCIVSEMPPGFVPRAKEFPRRNRIIAGVSLGVLVVEAARRSGTLVTARLAAELGREVFAIPGHPLDPRAEGTNQLLKSGAVFVTEAADLIAALQPMIEQPEDRGLAREPETPPAPFSEPALSHSDRQRVLSALGPHPSDVDEIGRAAGLSARAVRLVLVELDLAGRIERHGQHLVSLLPASGSFD
ncbi:MAG: DNA-processing protein DprA [Hyphomicrobiaceae bacterium]|nr:DNA-processing protein DprA [Hyphomicrobiaceae bacterium]